MPDDISIRLDKAPSETEMYQISLFRYRFEQLWSNWESLEAAGIKLGGSFQNKGSGSVGGSGCGIEPHRLKGYYLDFRFFFADKEPTHYFKVSNLIGKHSKDKRLHRCLAENKKNWQESGVLHEWHGFSAEEMTRVLFNGDFFHSIEDFQGKLTQLRASMSSDLAHHLLTFSIYNRMQVIRNLNWVIQPLSIDNPYVQIPEPFA